jgi:hypothetical protein
MNGAGRTDRLRVCVDRTQIGIASLGKVARLVRSPL